VRWYKLLERGPDRPGQTARLHTRAPAKIGVQIFFDSKICIPGAVTRRTFFSVMCFSSCRPAIDRHRAIVDAAKCLSARCAENLGSDDACLDKNEKMKFDDERCKIATVSLYRAKTLNPLDPARGQDAFDTMPPATLRLSKNNTVGVSVDPWITAMTRCTF
jgi:hypothetical protein